MHIYWHFIVFFHISILLLIFQRGFNKNKPFKSIKQVFWLFLYELQ